MPARKSSVSTVWMQGGDTHGFYYDVTQNNLNKNIKFIEANKLYKKYVHIDLDRENKCFEQCLWLMHYEQRKIFN